jgi:hypothetical protein
LDIDSKKEGDAPYIAPGDRAPQKPCGACSNENLSKICVDTKNAKTTGACCIQGDTSPNCTPGENIKCSPMLLKA